MSDSANTVPSRALQTILAAIGWAYGRVLDGDIGTVPNAEALARAYLDQSADVEAAIDRLIARQVLNAGAAGLVTGLGGVVTLPVAIPANLVSVLYLQLRLIAAIAHLRGHDIRSEPVRALALACLLGSSAGDVLKEVGVKAGTRLAQRAAERAPGALLAGLNTAVGVRLAARLGAGGAVNVSKLVPLLGGVVSGAFDAATTRAIGAAAKRVFAAREAAE